MSKYDEIVSIMNDNAIHDKKIDMQNQKALAEQAILKEQEEKIYSALTARENTLKEYQQFKINVKNTLLTEALLCLVNSCMDRTLIQEEYTQKLSRQLVSNFVLEESATRLLSRFKSTSYLLSEFAYLCNKYTDIITEKADKKDPSSFKIKDEDKKKFFKDLDKTNTDLTVSTIRSRVMSATQNFIDSNTKDKMKIKEILQSAKDKIEKTKDKKDAEKLQEAYVAESKRKITNIRASKTKSVFEAMVYAMSEQAFKNDDAKQVFVENSSLNMDKIVEHCEVMYTFLETLDTIKAINVNEAYIEQMIKDIKG